MQLNNYWCQCECYHFKDSLNTLNQIKHKLILLSRCTGYSADGKPHSINEYVYMQYPGYKCIFFGVSWFCVAHLSTTFWFQKWTDLDKIIEHRVWVIFLSGVESHWFNSSSSSITCKVLTLGYVIMMFIWTVALDSSFTPAVWNRFTNPPAHLWCSVWQSSCAYDNYMIIVERFENGSQLNLCYLQTNYSAVGSWLIALKAI